MKTSIKFLLVIVLLFGSIALLMDMGVRANTWTGWIILVALPAAGYLLAKTNFQSNE